MISYFAKHFLSLNMLGKRPKNANIKIIIYKYKEKCIYCWSIFFLLFIISLLRVSICVVFPQEQSPSNYFIVENKINNVIVICILSVLFICSEKITPARSNECIGKNDEDLTLTIQPVKPGSRKNSIVSFLFPGKSPTHSPEPESEKKSRKFLCSGIGSVDDGVNNLIQ